MNYLFICIFEYIFIQLIDSFSDLLITKLIVSASPTVSTAIHRNSVQKLQSKRKTWDTAALGHIRSLHWHDNKLLIWWKLSSRARQVTWRKTEKDGLRLPFSVACMTLTAKFKFQSESVALQTQRCCIRSGFQVYQMHFLAPCWGAAPWRPRRRWRPLSWTQTWGWRSRSCCPMSWWRCGCHRNTGRPSRPGQRRDGTCWFSQPSWTWWTGQKATKKTTKQFLHDICGQFEHFWFQDETD